MSTARFNKWENPDGTENFKCRAWVNFNGTGTVAIRAAGNVSSITDNGGSGGDYTINFTTALPDANYAFVGAAQDAGGGPNVVVSLGALTAPTTTALRIGNRNSAAGFTDVAAVCVAIFR